VHYQVGIVAPEVSVLWRFVIAIPITFAVARFRGERLRFKPADHLSFAAMGTSLFAAFFALSIYAAAFIPSGLISVVMSLVSVVNVGLSARFLGIPISRRIALGGLLGVIGVAAVFSPQLVGTELNSRALIGLCISLTAMLCFCGGNIISARLQRRGITIFAANGYAMTYAGLVLLAIILLRGLPLQVDWSLSYVFSSLYLGVIMSVIASVSLLGLIGRIGADRASYSLVVTPIVALALSALIEGYSVSGFAIFGMALTILGNVLVLRRSKR
jgi:drug/metabolite transporter (DMT)-like permease